MNFMKGIGAILILLLFSLASYANAEEGGNFCLGCHADIPRQHAVSADRGILEDLTIFPKEITETAEKLAVVTTFALVDYNQSVDMFYKQTGYHEVNPLLGRSPSRSELITFGTAGLGALYIAALTLPDPWRQIALDSVIATEQLNIEENRRVYQGWNTDGPPLQGRTFDTIPILISFRF